MFFLTFFVKTNDGRDRRLHSATFVVWSVSSFLAQSLERDGNMSSSFYRQSADYYSHVFSLIHPVDEFPFKEKRSRVQPIIISCCLCVTCVSRDLGVRGVKDS